VKPDVPLTALERCYLGHAYRDPIPLLAECWSDHPLGRISYLVALHAWRRDEPLDVRVSLAELGDAAPRGRVAALDGRTGAVELLEPDATLAFTLAPRDYAFRVLAPVAHDELAVFGDTVLFACAGDRRIRGLRASGRGIELEVLGAPGERVTISGWSARNVSASGGEPLRRDPSTGCFSVSVEIPDRGWTPLAIE